MVPQPLIWHRVGLMDLIEWHACPGHRWGHFSLIRYSSDITDFAKVCYKSFGLHTYLTVVYFDIQANPSSVNRYWNSLAVRLNLGRLPLQNSPVMSPGIWCITKCEIVRYPTSQQCPYCRADSRFAPSQWETVLLCNDVSHWLGTSL